jgi:CRP-like cAMP-binding protein
MPPELVPVDNALFPHLLCPGRRRGSDRFRGVGSNGESIMNTEQVVSVLRKCEVFGRLSDEEFRAVAALARSETFDAGEVIYTQGTTGTKLYVLCEGLVILERAMHIEGKRNITVPVFVQRETPSRRLMGAWSSLVGEAHVQMCTARCSRPTTVIALPCADLTELISRDAETRVKILEKLVLLLRDRIASSYEEIEAM